MSFNSEALYSLRGPDMFSRAITLQVLRANFGLNCNDFWHMGHMVTMALRVYDVSICLKY